MITYQQVVERDRIQARDLHLAQDIRSTPTAERSEL